LVPNFSIIKIRQCRQKWSHEILKPTSKKCPRWRSIILWEFSFVLWEFFGSFLLFSCHTKLQIYGAPFAFFAAHIFAAQTHFFTRIHTFFHLMLWIEVRSVSSLIWIFLRLYMIVVFNGTKSLHFRNLSLETLTSGCCASLSAIQLDALVSNHIIGQPRRGEIMIRSCINSSGFHVTRRELRECMHRVDPEGIEQ
jgi:hypothetical protein